MIFPSLSKEMMTMASKTATVIPGSAPKGASTIPHKAKGATTINAGHFKAAKHAVHKKAHPGPGWDDKTTATRNSRKGVNNRFK
jgi:hypothetical protein